VQAIITGSWNLLITCASKQLPNRNHRILITQWVLMLIWTIFVIKILVQRLWPAWLNGQSYNLLNNLMLLILFKRFPQILEEWVPWLGHIMNVSQVFNSVNLQWIKTNRVNPNKPKSWSQKKVGMFTGLGLSFRWKRRNKVSLRTVQVYMQPGCMETWIRFIWMLSDEKKKKIPSQNIRQIQKRKPVYFQ
jgi:hypothetical protein